MPQAAIPPFSLFIPAYNAAKTLESVLKRIPEEAWEACGEAWVISRGSNDGTEQVAEALMTHYPKLRLFSEAQNDGYGGTVRRGLQCCTRDPRAQFIVCLHGDGQYPPEQIGRFLRHMHDNQLDLLQGSRHATRGTARAGGMPIAKIIGGKVLTWIENQALGLGFTDYHSGYMFYSRPLIDQLPIEVMSHYFDFDLEAIACARSLNLPVGELAIDTHYGEETSNLNVFVYSFNCLGVVARYATGYYARHIENLRPPSSCPRVGAK